MLNSGIPNSCLTQTSPLGSSKLAQQLIGPWLKAPKAARQAYEQYIKTAAGCLGGEPSSAEIQEAALSIWDALQDAPPPAKLQQGRTSVSAAVKPYRYGQSIPVTMHPQAVMFCELTD